MNLEDKTGEVELLAVHPDDQHRGLGTALNTAMVEQMRAGGVLVASVGAGGDPGHAPASRADEQAGYAPLPLVRYSRKRQASRRRATRALR
ncbi:MAG TPA: GNAT family N-acetyltransferase [Thermomicrobiales bacterium]|nr:GNAT family N-acetyltransferase [Thermomicrobiales bacterium]